MRAILYARVSRGNWQDRARKLMNQLEECRNTARKNGWRVVSEMAENEGQTSGTSWNLPELNEIMDRATAGSFDVLVVTEIDRLSRTLAKQIVIEQELDRLGIKIEYVNRHYKETSDGRLDKHIRSAIAEYEQSKIVDRLHRGLRATVKAGNILIFSCPPYGYFGTYEDGLRKLSILKDESYVVRLIFHWYTKGDSDFNLPTTISIARKLRQLWLPTPGHNRGLGGNKRKDEWRHWSRYSVLKILIRETYKGSWYYGKHHRSESEEKSKINREERLCVEVPSIIDAGTWEKARRNRCLKRVQGAMKYQYILGERLRCLLCDRKLSIAAYSYRISEKRQFRSYCRHAHRNNNTCNNKAYYQHLSLEIAVFEWAYHQFGGRAFRNFQLALREKYIVQLEEEMNIVHILTTQKYGQQKRLEKLSAEALLPAQDLQERKRNLDHTIDALEKEKIRLRSKLELLGERWPDDIDITDPSYIYPKDQNADYIIRRSLIEHLDIRGIVGTIDGTKLAHIKSRLGQITFRIPNRISKDTEAKARPVDINTFGYRITSNGDLRKMDH